MGGILAGFIARTIGKVIRGGGETSAKYKGLAEARQQICNECPHKGKVGIKNTFLSVDGCTVCSCPLMTKTKTLLHRDYRYGIDWNNPDFFKLNDVPFVRTVCDLGKWEQVDTKFLGQHKNRLIMCTVKSIGDLGKKRANKYANPANMARLNAVGADEVQAFQDTVTLTGGKTVSHLKIDGEYIAVSGDLDDATLMVFHGMENNTYVNVSETEILHIGQCRLEGVKYTDDTETAAVTLETIVKVQGLVAPVPADTSTTVVINDVNGVEVSSDTIATDYSTVSQANANALAAEILALLPATSTVTAVAGDDSYFVTVVLANGAGGFIGGVELIETGNPYELFA